MRLMDRLVGLRDHLKNNWNIAEHWIENHNWDGVPCMLLAMDKERKHYLHGGISTTDAFKEVSNALGGTHALYILKNQGKEFLLTTLERAIARLQEQEVIETQPTEPSCDTSSPSLVSQPS